MCTTIMAITINRRSNHAPLVQQVLTEHGCIIKMRLGLHEASGSSCSEDGLILLQLCSDQAQISALKKNLSAIDGVKVHMMNIS